MYLRSLAAVVLLLSLTAAESMSDSSALESVATSVHDVLPLYGLPKGLLPNSVKSYSLKGNGEFEIELSAPCYVQFSDLVYYERHIKGKLSYGSISDLSGIKAKKLFVWVSITGIAAHPDDSTIVFEVGFLSESLPVAQFAEIPVCKAKVGCRGAAGIISEVLPISEMETQTSSLFMYQDTMLQRSKVLGDVGGRKERQRSAREVIPNTTSTSTSDQVIARTHGNYGGTGKHRNKLPDYVVIFIVIHKSFAFGWPPQHLSSGYSPPDLQPLPRSSFNASAYADVLLSDLLF